MDGPGSYRGTVPEPRTISLRVLVVDDNQDTALSMATLLQLSGAEARIALDGEAAVALAEEFRPDAVLMDIGMPQMNGYDACRIIRQKLCEKPPLMIAVTGWGQKEDRRRSMEAGFDHHITKPVDFEFLTRLLAT